MSKPIFCCNTLILVILILSFLIFNLSFPALAANMSSDNYELQMGNFNMTSGNKSSPGYKLLDTVGQNAPGQYNSQGYIVKAGFEYIKTLIPFSFSISDLSIDFGSLAASNPVTQTNTLTVSSGTGFGYQVTAFEDHPMQIPGTSTQIPDTVCDGGAETCDQITAAVWSSNTAYGFGFNMNSDTHPDDIPADFDDNTHFRQFTDISLAETPQVVMTSPNVGRNKQAVVTYKINVSGGQAAGDYETNITFICTPGY
jgi:hypothetical protein